jgi:perosamine synthetase
MNQKSKKKIILAEPSIPRSKTLNYLKKVIKDNFPNEGKYTRIFEKKLSKLLNVKYVVTCTSGTISIFLALKALGIRRKDEVLVPNITFPATLNAISLLGAKPVLVDVNKDTLLMSVENLKKKINKKTRAILPVHVSGRGSNVKEIAIVAKKNKLFLVEDAAEAFMSSINKKYLGTFGEVGCFSFAPNKILTTGQGGAIVTNIKPVYIKLKQLKDQGRIGSTTGGEDNYQSIGYNFKFTNLQASLGLAQLETIKLRMKILKNHHLFYKKNIKKNKNLKLFNFNLKSGELPLWTDILCTKRNKLFEFLKSKNIIGRYFWHPINQCKPYKQSFKDLKNSKQLQNKLMWLPSSLNMKKKDLIKVSKCINQFIEKNYKNE